VCTAGTYPLYELVNLVPLLMTASFGIRHSGFASTQEAYDIAFGELFEALDRVEGRFNLVMFVALSHPSAYVRSILR